VLLRRLLLPNDDTACADSSQLLSFVDASVGSDGGGSLDNESSSRSDSPLCCGCCCRERGWCGGVGRDKRGMVGFFCDLSNLSISLKEWEHNDMLGSRKILCAPATFETLTNTARLSAMAAVAWLGIRPRTKNSLERVDRSNLNCKRNSMYFWERCSDQAMTCHSFGSTKESHLKTACV
jgi:hypothetical protein